jgi:hypothetical protein
MTKKVNPYPESSETDGVKISTVYLHSCAKDFLRNSMNMPLPVFLGAFEAVLKSTFWNAAECFFFFFFFSFFLPSRPSEWPDCQLSDDLSMVVSVLGIRKKKSQGGKFGEMAHAAVQRFDVLTDIVSRIMPYAVAHFGLGGTTFLSPTT